MIVVAECTFAVLVSRLLLVMDGRSLLCRDWRWDAGTELGRVKEGILPGSHLVVTELIDQTAIRITDYLGGELDGWRENERSFERQWARKDLRQKQMVDERWIRMVKNEDESQRAGEVRYRLAYRSHHLTHCHDISLRRPPSGHGVPLGCSP